jgi:ABC-2 type transport system permease protein
MNWWHILKREIRHMFITDRRRAIFLFGASLAYLILFSLLYGTHTVKAVPLVIYDEDQTQFSRSLIQAFDDSERFQIIDYVTTQDDMEKVLHEKEAYAAVHIPKKFAQDAKSVRSSTVLLIADGANIIITNTVTSSAQEIIATFAKETGARLTEMNNGQLPSTAANTIGPIDFRLRVLNNPTQSYLSFFVLGLSMAAFQQGIFLAVGASILSEYQNPDKLKNAHPLSIITGKLFPYWFAATIAFFLTETAAVHFFEIPGKASMISLFFLSTTFIFAAIGFSAFIASLCNNELTFTRISIAYTVPAFVLSGYTWPQEAMDTIGKTISYTFPLSFFSNTFRELMIAGYSPYLYRNSLILLLFGLVFTLFAMVCYIRKIKQIHRTANF